MTTATKKEVKKTVHPYIENIGKALTSLGLKHTIHEGSDIEDTFFSMELSSNREFFNLGIDVDNPHLKIAIATSKKYKQAVITVREPSRKVKQTGTINVPKKKDLKTARYTVSNVTPSVPLTERGLRTEWSLVEVKQLGKTFIGTYERTIHTPITTITFLLGIDESHYFISMLPKVVDSVEEAHKVLRPKDMPSTVRLRQGEFFFEKVDLNKELCNEKIIQIQCDHKVPLMRDNGRETDHQAEIGFWVEYRDNLEGIQFVARKITNPRHETLDLGDSYYRVWSNTELESDGQLYD